MSCKCEKQERLHVAFNDLGSGLPKKGDLVELCRSDENGLDYLTIVKVTDTLYLSGKNEGFVRKLGKEDGLIPCGCVIKE